VRFPVDHAPVWFRMSTLSLASARTTDSTISQLSKPVTTRYHQKCKDVSMLSVWYLLSNVTKIGTCWQISIKIPKVEFHENPSAGRGAVPCGYGRTAVHDEAKSIRAGLSRSHLKTYVTVCTLNQNSSIWIRLTDISTRRNFSVHTRSMLT